MAVPFKFLAILGVAYVVYLGVSGFLTRNEMVVGKECTTAVEAYVEASNRRAAQTELADLKTAADRACHVAAEHARAVDQVLSE